MSDLPTPLAFVNPDEIDTTYRVCLWAAPGEGKSVAAASAPAPILVVSADRPSAYRYARKHYPGKDIREVRYVDHSTLTEVYQYLKADDCDVRTVVLDPVSHIYDQLVDTAPLKEGDVDYQRVNKVLLRFVKSLRAFDVNVVLVAHEKLNDGKKGDGKMYPALGGPALINKLLAEMDIVAHIERVVREVEGQDEPTVTWVGQVQPARNLVGKDSTNALGPIRVADLTRWFEVADAAYAVDDTDLPWPDEGEEVDAEAQLDLDEARAEASA